MKQKRISNHIQTIISLQILLMAFALCRGHSVLSAQIYYKKDSIKKQYLHDGPYISWKKSKLKVIYYEKPAGRERIFKTKNIFLSDSSNFQFHGFANDSLTYSIRRNNTIQEDTFENVDSIFVVGDIHGAYADFIALLQNNQVIDENMDWQWGKGHLVLEGDVFDKGNNVTECLWLIYKLCFQAQQAGGRVHYLIGTHEVLALTGFHGYLSKKYHYLYTRRNISYSELFKLNTILGKWIRSKNTMIKINNILFVHAGISNELAELRISINNLNELIRNYLNNPYATENDVRLKIAIGDKGPYWYRGYNYGEKGFETTTSENIDKILNFYSANHIIFGHTEIKNIKSTLNGRLINIDVPMNNDSFRTQALLIKDNNFYIAYINGERKKLIVK